MSDPFAPIIDEFLSSKDKAPKFRIRLTYFKSVGKTTDVYYLYSMLESLQALSDMINLCKTNPTAGIKEIRFEVMTTNHNIFDKNHVADLDGTVWKIVTTWSIEIVAKIVETTNHE